MSRHPWALALEVLDGITPYRVHAGGYLDALDLDLNTCADYRLVCARLGVQPGEGTLNVTHGMTCYQTRHATGWVQHAHPADQPCPEEEQGALFEEVAA